MRFGCAPSTSNCFWSPFFPEIWMFRVREPSSHRLSTPIYYPSSLGLDRLSAVDTPATAITYHSVLARTQICPSIAFAYSRLPNQRPSSSLLSFVLISLPLSYLTHLRPGILPLGSPGLQATSSLSPSCRHSQNAVDSHRSCGCTGYPIPSLHVRIMSK